MDTICWLSHQSVSRTLSPLNTSNTSPRVQIHIISCLDHYDSLLPTPSFHPCPLTFSMLGPEIALSNTHESQLFSSIHLPPDQSSASKPKFLNPPGKVSCDRHQFPDSSNGILLSGAPWNSLLVNILHTHNFPRCVHGTLPLLLQVFYK